MSDEFVVAGTVGRGAFPGTRSGSLVEVDRTSGRILWMHVDPPGEELARSKAEWGFAAGPVIADGIVYAADLQGRVYALTSSTR